MKKTTKTIMSVILALACLVFVICIGAFVGSKILYHDFYANAKRSIAIPLSDGFVPQGFHYDAQNEVFLISGYMKDSTQPSRIYAVDKDGKKSYVTLKDTAGAAYTGHCGGITVNGDYVYISSEEEFSVFSLTEILSGETAKQLGSIETGERMSFCSFVDGYLVAGSFYRAESYETPQYHHVTTPAGDENPALIWIYPANEDCPFGIDAQPIAALSVREQVQGLVVTDDGEIVLSTSWGLSTSVLWRYKPDARQGSVSVDGRDVPLYYLDSENLVDTVKAPPMSEEMVYLDGRVYIMTESACSKYFFGNLIDGRHVFAYQF